MRKVLVAALQRLMVTVFWTVRFRLFAYNELPAIAVANDCWFRARQDLMRPFFMFPRLIQSLKCPR